MSAFRGADLSRVGPTLTSVGLKDRLKGLTKPVDELERDRLSKSFAALEGLDPLSDIPLRRPSRVGGEVKGVRVVPRAGSPSLEVTVGDGSGEAVAIFYGRRRIKGIEVGRSLLLEGVARADRNRVVIVNPSYTLLP